MIPEQFQISFWWDELSLISAYTTFEILRKNPARHQIKMPTPGIICKKIVHQILDCSSYLYFQIKSAKRKTQLPEVRIFTTYTLLLTIVYLLCVLQAQRRNDCRGWRATNSWSNFHPAGITNTSTKKCTTQWNLLLQDIYNTVAMKFWMWVTLFQLET